MIALLARFKLYLILAGIMLALFSWGTWERGSRIKVQARYDGFVAEAKAIAAIQLVERQRKEKENEERIKSANLDRDIALERLRLSTADSSRLRSLLNSFTAGSSGKVCLR